MQTKQQIEQAAIAELKEIREVDASYPEKLRFSADMAIRDALRGLGMKRLVAEWEAMDEISGRCGRLCPIDG